MIEVEKWIQEPKDVRTAHIDMSESCIERGGNSTSHRGILAQYLNTNFPSKIDLCHFCGNDKCSNPKHLYWGTRSENVVDSQRHGTWTSPWNRLVEKHGYEEACAINSKKMLGNTSGAGNKGKPKSEEHKKKISLNHKGGRPKGWKKSKSESGEIGETQQT